MLKRKWKKENHGADAAVTTAFAEEAEDVSEIALVAKVKCMLGYIMSLFRKQTVTRGADNFT